ncbi:alpha/beta fold hydrolase [Marinobacterium jannaschii]|uniref:alpha/beta fold hydrolase n=1 Tax=Marinobacterium jannaschii TaxID=64970 RepID=UPI0004879D55|nr:alpha/beta hydrolase [Marinobacterium jannaschii]
MQWSEHYQMMPNGVRLHYRYGKHPCPGSDTVLVFLHEALGCIAMWKQYPQQLARLTGCDVLIYERYGYGGSTALQEARKDNYLVVEGEYYLPQLLKQQQLEKVILIGHSDGGSVALVGAATSPSVVGIVTEAAHAYVDDMTLEGIRAAKELYRRTDLHSRLERYHGERTGQLFDAWCDTWMRDSFQQDLQLGRWLREISCPALIMQGEDDQYGESRQVDYICQAIGAAAEPCMLKDCGHIPHFEAAEQCLTHTADFVTRLIKSPQPA